MIKKITSFIISFYVATSFAQTKPNIVIIISDDHAYQAIGAYGNKWAHTPNIDRIAKEGVLFKKSYVTNSICGPSRAVILTGKYSHKNGFKDNETSQFNHGQDNFAKQLQANGYQTAWVGKVHLGEKLQGFDYYNLLPDQGSYYNPDFIGMDGKETRKDGYVANIITEEAEKWLDKRDKTKPFCVVIGHKSTHRAWLPDTTDFGKYDKVNFPLPQNFYDNYDNRPASKVQEMTIEKSMQMGYDLKMLSYSKDGKEPAVDRMNAAQRAKFDAYYKPIETDLKERNLTGKALSEWKYQRYMRDYMSTADGLDRNIGRTLDYLDQHDLTKNTVVIYLSDQGFYLGEHGWFDKRWMYEESFRTPMVMRYPGVVKSGSIENNFVLNLDITPTLLDLAGAKIPADVQGESFLPLIVNKNTQGRETIYYHYYENGEHAVSPHFGIRTERYKLIRFYKRVEGWELYDLKTDPSEMKNIYKTKGNEKLIAGLKKKLKILIDQYQDTDACKIFDQ